MNGFHPGGADFSLRSEVNLKAAQIKVRAPRGTASAFGRLVLNLCVLGALSVPVMPMLSAANINDDVAKYVNAPRTFPTWESAKPIDGSLVEVDVIHRTGIFREDGSGTLRTFVMPANGVVGRLGAEGDLRDVPLGTHGRFYLLPDKRGALAQLGAFLDDASQNQRSGVTLTVVAVDVANGRITVQPFRVGGPISEKDRFDLITDRTAA